MADLLQRVKPMRNALGDRMPILLWNVPIPARSVVSMKTSGALDVAVTELAKRGIVPMPVVGFDWTTESATAMAQTLQDRHRPVYVLVSKLDVIESTVWRDATLKPEAPDASRGGRKRQWPCLPLNDVEEGSRWVEGQLTFLKRAGIRVNGVWFDDEGLPHPWNGIYESQKGSDECAGCYPPGVLASPARFAEYVFRLRADLVSQVLVKPVHKLFPGALVGNYAEFASSVGTPFVDPNDNAMPAVTPGGDVLMPSLYANTADLPRRLRGAPSVTQAQADRIYFDLMLRSLSTCAANKRGGLKLVPYVGQAVYDNPDPKLHLHMSRPFWREFQWHLWLRGADGVFVFNLGFPGSPVTPAESFQSVEDVRDVYDQVLGRREFLRGEIMNLKSPAAVGERDEPVWSGLRLPGRCLVHAFSPTGEPQKVQIEAYPGVSVTLDAPAGGATYLVSRDGTVTPVKD